MSANPQMMAQMLASQLGGQQQPQSVGGMQGQGSPIGAAAQMAQKIMLMRALQQGQPLQQPQMPPPAAGPGQMPLPPGQPLPATNNLPMPGVING